MPKANKDWKEEKIKREIARFEEIFKDLDENKQAVIQGLIRNIAFMTVTLDDLTETIARQNYSEEYQNGRGQRGIKQSTELKTHLAMTKNLSIITKQLVDLCPVAKKESRLESMLRE